MLVKDIINIEKGRLISGLTVKPYLYNDELFDPKDKYPRVAKLNLDGWDYPEPKFSCDVIRTIFYPSETKPSFVNPFTKDQIKDIGINKCIIDDPWSYWGDYKFIEFIKGNPIGVHLSEFIIGACINKSKKNYINLYTKILLISGEIGYLALETEKKSKIEAELI